MPIEYANPRNPNQNNNYNKLMFLNLNDQNIYIKIKY